MASAQPHRVLVVEDESLDRAFMVEALRSPAHEVLEVSDAGAAKDLLTRQHIDLMVLDLVLPDQHGLELLASIRTHDTVPVLVVSGVSSVSERIAALRMGADDFVTKPVDPGELSARCGALLRRAAMGVGRRRDGVSRYRGPGFTLDLDRREVLVDDVEVELTPIEFSLLAYLVSRQGQAVSRQELGREVWKASDDRSVSATVTEHVRRLRNKLRDGEVGPSRLRTVRGVGYRFVL
jgi:two-component system, OmpR family, phosphate regulon response regulator PhoB